MSLSAKSRFKQFIRFHFERLKFVTERGFFHIFGSKVINRIARFGASIIIIRILTKELYGSFSYAMNILELFLLLNGLGVAPAILQFCSERKETKDKLPFLKYGLSVGIKFNLLIAAAIILYTQFFDLPVKRSDEILFYLCLIPIFIIVFEIMGSYLRSNFKNREFSYLSVSNTLLYFVGTVIGGLLLNVYGIIAGRYLAFLIAIMIGARYLKKETKYLKQTDKPITQEKRRFFKYSVIVALTNSISQILYLLDIFLIGIILKEQNIVASYKTATLIPFALTFVPLSVMTFVYPYFAQNYKDKPKTKKYFYDMQKYLLVLNFGISSILIIFAPLIIKILFGSQYLDAVVPFRILSLGYFIAGSFRIPAGNVIASIRKVKVNLINSAASGTLNIVLDILLISRFGAVGAAVATTSIFLFSSIVSNVYLFIHFHR